VKTGCFSGIIPFESLLSKLIPGYVFRNALTPPSPAREQERGIGPLFEINFVFVRVAV
jgi:hypothetical protein